MFLIFKRVEDKLRGVVQIKGRFLNYDIGYIPNTHVDIIPYAHLNATIIDDIQLAMIGCSFKHGMVK